MEGSMKSRRSVNWLRNKVTYMVLVCIGLLIIFANPMFAQAQSNDIEKYNIQTFDLIRGYQPNIPLYPELKWKGEIAKTQLLSIDGYPKPLIAPGFYNESESFYVDEKPPQIIYDYYASSQIADYKWKRLGFLDKPNSIGIMYRHAIENRYMVAQIEECNYTEGNLDAVSRLPAHLYCVKIWYSEILPISNQMQPTNSSGINKFTPYYPLILNYDNPLPIPFYSQRNSDPNDNIILGFGSSCTATIHDAGCALTAHTMIYNYYQTNYTSVISLNESMKVSPGVYSCSGNCCNLWPISAPDAPAGVSFGSRYVNDCTTPNCIDSGNEPIIDNAISSGRPLHVRVHPSGGSYNSHSVVIIGHSGSDYYIKDPWATDDTQRTLMSGALGQYVVDYIDTINGTPPGGGGACSGPALQNPPDGYISTSQTVNFSWSAVSGCTFNGYTFRIKDTSNMDSGGNTIVDTGEGGTSRTETIGSQWNNKDLYWGVKAANAPNGANWSVRRFRIEPSPSCNPGINQISLFVDANYGGQCVTKDIGEYSNPSVIGLPNDSISSIRVGFNVRGILCNNDNYGGGCETFTGDDSNLSDNGIGDNQVSSVKVESRYPIELFMDSNYNNGYCYTTGTGWFNLDGDCASYNNAISSILLQPNFSVRVYKDSNLSGSYACLTSSDSDLSNNNYDDGSAMNESISSMEVFNQSGCPPLIDPPLAPTLMSPANDSDLATNTGITLNWNSSSGATEYYAHLWGGPGIDMNSTWIGATNWQIGTLLAGTYQWEVNARNEAGESGYSEIWNFTVLPPEEQVRVTNVLTTDENFQLKTQFDPGNAILYILEVENVTDAVADITLTFDVRGPNNEIILYWNGTVSTSPGFQWWYYASTIEPGYGGTHTFNGSGLYSGTTSQGSTTYFVTGLTRPGPFGKSAPTDNETGVPVDPVFQWGASNGAESYEYCFDSIDDNICNETWSSVGANTIIGLSGLDDGTTYYWQVRATNAGGTTYADGDSTAYWDFTTSADIFLVIQPFSTTVSLGQNFDVVIEVQAGTQLLDGAAAYLNFDPTYLQVISITPGSSLPALLENSHDNTTGQVNYAAGTLSGPISGTFTLATITFNAFAQTPGTSILFNEVDPRKSDITYAGISILSGIEESTVTITNSASTQGSVILQGRPTPPDPRWIVPLTVILTLPGETTPIFSFTPTTDTSGQFTLSEITPGTYDVWIKNSHTLRNITPVTILAGMNVFDFGTLKEGDANDDNFVALVDFSILANTFSKCMGANGYDERADFNEDNCISMLDFSLLANNFGQGGALNGSSPESTSAVLKKSQDDVLILVNPSQMMVQAGDTFTVTIQVQSGRQLIDAVQANLDFDPKYLKVVSISPNTSKLPLVLVNQYDNSLGTVDYTSGTLSNFPGDTIDLVTIEFMAVQDIPETSLVFHAGGQRNTEITFGGESIVVEKLDGKVTIGTEIRHTILPVLSKQA